MAKVTAACKNEPYDITYHGKIVPIDCTNEMKNSIESYGKLRNATTGAQ